MQYFRNNSFGVFSPEWSEKRPLEKVKTRAFWPQNIAIKAMLAVKPSAFRWLILTRWLQTHCIHMHVSNSLIIHFYILELYLVRSAKWRFFNLCFNWNWRMVFRISGDIFKVLSMSNVAGPKNNTSIPSTTIPKVGAFIWILWLFQWECSLKYVHLFNSIYKIYIYMCISTGDLIGHFPIIHDSLFPTGHKKKRPRSGLHSGLVVPWTLEKIEIVILNPRQPRT